MKRGSVGNRGLRPGRASDGDGRASAREIVRAVRRGQRSPFLQGSPESIAYALTEELKRHATLAGRSPLGAAAQMALDVHDPHAASDPPPVPGSRPLAPRETQPAVPGEKPSPPPRPLWWPQEVVQVSVDFADAIARAEGSNGYDALLVEDGEPAAFGRYQFRGTALLDIGLMDERGRWREAMGVRSTEEFLDNPALQDAAFTAYIGRMRSYLDTLHAFVHVGQPVRGLNGNFLIGEAGLLAAAHRQGQGAVARYLAHQQAHGWNSDFSELAEDTRRVFQSIETRLRVFASVPLTRDHLSPPLVPAMPTR